MRRARCAGSSASRPRCGRTCRSSARSCWWRSRSASSSTSPSSRTRAAATRRSRRRPTPTCNAQVPAYVILTVVAAGVAALLLLANIWFRTLWLLGLTAGGVVRRLSILVGGLYPGLVQTFQVNPNEQTRRAAVHREAHRAPRARRSTSTRSSERTLHRRADADPRRVRRATRPRSTTCGCGTTGRCSPPSGSSRSSARYYDFRDVDIDRYDVGGQQRQIMLSARELRPEQAAGRGAAPGRTSGSSTRTATGSPPCRSTRSRRRAQPDYLVSGINREPQLPVGEPRIYFGEATDTYVVTGTTTEEFDYPLTDGLRHRRHHDLEGHDRGRDRQLRHPRCCSRSASATSTCSSATS